MNKMYSICTEYSPVYECITSFYTFIHYKHVKSVRMGQDWYERTKQQLPPSFAAELEDERWEVLHRVVLLIPQCPAKNTVEDFLHWLAQLPAGQLYELLAPWVTTMPLNLSEVRDKSVSLLRNWNRYYFQHFDPAILSQLEKEANQLTRQSEQMSPIDLIEEKTNGIVIEPSDHLRQVILIPQYHSYPSSVLDFYGNAATCLYPTRCPGDEEVQRVEHILQMSQCLSDEKRLRILMYIAEGPRTLREIHQHSKLAKSTVHHHVTALRKVGFIRVHYVDNTTHCIPAYYSLRKGQWNELASELQALLGDRRESQ
ncbi:ArsR/SmtB family transcription factor [Brevibacillus sp. SYSU BS000544]|uniref:ArsR/SmtB family transcription factor n=1 Tax=Brevibacillus sp. SYSU BS000544 TaxID=3416443 RepID=UPI003CE59EEE